jgi:glycosyltransferase involved in cell wall biosynthesis
MRKKNVLIVSYTYPPANAPAAQRPYSIAKYLDKNQFNVTVLTCGNADSSLGFNLEFDPELPDVNLIKLNSFVGRGASTLRKSKMDGKRSLKNRLKTSLFNLFSSLVVPDKAIFWYPKVRSFLIENKEFISELDVVYTTSPAFSNHLIGKAIKKRNCKVMWVSELRDFHSVELVKNVKNIKQYINRKLENIIIQKSDKVTFISGAMKELYELHYPSFKSKFSYVYNGFDISDFERLPIAETQNSKLTIFYAGSFYRGVRSPHPLLKIIDSLIKNDIINLNEIEIRIAGNFENELIDEIKVYNSFSTVNLLGNISRSEVLSNLVTSDLLWLIVGNHATHYTGVPVKFYEYLGARRPIINFAPDNSEPSKIISKNNLGWNFDTLEFNLELSTSIFEQIIIKHRAGIVAKSLDYRFYPEFDRKHQGNLFGELFSGN